MRAIRNDRAAAPRPDLSPNALHSLVIPALSRDPPSLQRKGYEELWKGAQATRPPPDAAEPRPLARSARADRACGWGA